jgi:hypothetical protein
VHTQRTRKRVDLVARGVEERAALCGVAVEVGERRPVGTAGDERRLIAGGLDLKALEAIVGKGQPVSALRVLTLVDEIQAHLALAGHDIRDGSAQLGLAGGGRLGQVRQAARVGGEDAIGAASHRRPPMLSHRGGRGIAADHGPAVHAPYNRGR